MWRPETVLAVVGVAGFTWVHFCRTHGGRVVDPESRHSSRGALARNPARILSGVDRGDATISQPKRKYERLGHVVIVRCDSIDFDPEEFARAFVPPVFVVLRDTVGISGELRTPQLEVVWIDNEAARECSARLRDSICRQATETQSMLPLTAADAATVTSVPQQALLESSTLTCITEQGTKYCMDALRVMFCSGNTTERMHFGDRVDAQNEVVVDMFAGIGYFTIPLLRSRTGPKFVFALEKNPDSSTFLLANGRLNGVADRLVVLCGDNRVVGESLIGACDRVIMGYIPDCRHFLKRAVSFLRLVGDGPRGIVHYHYLAPDKHAAYSVAFQHVVEIFGEDVVTGDFKVNDVRVVKSFAPKKWHCVADLVFGRAFDSP